MWLGYLDTAQEKDQILQAKQVSEAPEYQEGAKRKVVSTIVSTDEQHQNANEPTKA